MTDSTDERAFSRQRERDMGFVPRTPFEEYRDKYAQFVRMERRNGIIEVRLHTDDGPALYSSDVHNAWPRMFVDIGQDPDNEVLLLTGTGDMWIAGFSPKHSGAGGASSALQTLPTDAFYDHLVNDAAKIMESFIFNIDIPTIACINGPGMHTEFALMCDVTLCADHTVFNDPHFKFDVVPGDGLGLTFQELMGLKRSAWYLYTSDDITAEQAREMGLVNEVLPLERLLARGREVAEMIMRRPRNVRRLTASVLRRPWKRRLTQDLGFHIQAEMLAARIAN